ncbi:hypothetical protein L1987_43658 [Smallanthus sonchifolius]|uniref:Uncharacterized protein n=1 Tax=Smallanthus sonchifolius TaxID=185202 RepID=A0ACB9GP97_9ASTR|nr:hypothetical protein L1987_43658 [Smallanthus sonchifolius]
MALMVTSRLDFKTSGTREEVGGRVKSPSDKNWVLQKGKESENLTEMWLLEPRLKMVDKSWYKAPEEEDLCPLSTSKSEKKDDTLEEGENSPPVPAGENEVGHQEKETSPDLENIIDVSPVIEEVEVTASMMHGGVREPPTLEKASPAPILKNKY